MTNKFLEQLTELGVHLDPQLLELALTHRSYAYEHGQIPTNERLEFLGDAVLEMVVTEHLYLAFPDQPEGELAKLRAAVVSAVSLGSVARELGIGHLIKLGHGEISTGGKDKTSILADTMEALIGALYLTDSAGAFTFVSHVFNPLVGHAATLGAGLDWKTSLQEAAVVLGLEPPSYRITESGPDHDKRFKAFAVLGDREFAPGHGRSKKVAEQEAAEHAFRALQPEVEAARAASAEAVGAASS